MTTDQRSPAPKRRPRTFWGRLSLPTRILIGMAAGVMLGLSLGPRSLVLEKNTLIYEDRAKADLRQQPVSRAARIKVSGEGDLRLQVVGQHTDAKGEKWHAVEIHRQTGGGMTGGLRRLANASDETMAAKAAESGETKGQPARASMRIRPGPHRAWVRMATAPARVSPLGYDLMGWISPFGELFLRLIKMIIVPLVFASLLLGVASLGDLGKLGKMGGLTLGYFLATTAVAITVGLLFANLLRPGQSVEARDREQLSQAYADEAREKAEKKIARKKGHPETFLDRIVEMVPDVPLHAAAKEKPDMLQVIVFAILMGVGFILIGADKARPALEFFDSINEVMVKIVQMVMELAPYGVLALLAAVSGSAGVSVLSALAAYTGVVLAALVIHGTVTYGLALRFLSRFPLRRFFRGIRKAQLIAFSTSSSSATLPVSIQVAEENLGVTNRTASFVLPLGATINMDGTALYQGVAAVFIAQVFGMDLTVSQQLEVLFTATLASVGAAGVPGAGIVTLAMVLAAIGVPVAGIALILGVDRLLDMFRTTVNVTGDLSCTVFVARMTGEFAGESTAEGRANDA